MPALRAPTRRVGSERSIVLGPGFSFVPARAKNIMLGGGLPAPGYLHCT